MIIAEEAIDLVHRKRPLICPKRGFVRQLKLFYKISFTLTIHTNDKELRNFLIGTIKSYQISEYQSPQEVLANYYKSFSSEDQPNRYFGPTYCCHVCSRVAFSQINIITNVATNR